MPNLSLEPTRTGMALGPLSGGAYHPPRGPSTLPALAAQLKRWRHMILPKPVNLLARTLLALAAAVPVLLSGCSNVPLIRAVQLDRLDPFTEAKAKLPLLAGDSIRLFVYRPQALVGMAGSAIVVVDGNRLGNPQRPTIENLLLPGAVFVVDTPAKLTRVWWEQAGQGDESAKAIELAPELSRTWYLRWDLRPTHGYLQIVSEKQALPEIEPLRMSGYVTLSPK